MIHRLFQQSLRLNAKRIPKRQFSAEKETKKPREEQNDDDIWEDQDEEQEAENATPKNQIWRYFKSVLLWGTFGALGYNGYIASKTEYDEEAAKNELGYVPYIYSVSSAIASTFGNGYSYLLYPPMKKFLPDEPPLKAELLRKTLILNFEGTLYAKDFSVGQGVLIHLRPGFKKFMEKMSQFYDIVLYSNEDTAFMSEVAQTIDPYQKYFIWNFGREFMTTMPDGQYKDLKLMNRDPKKFIAVDFSTNSYLNHKENVVLLDQYKGEVEDNGLRELSMFLEHCATQNVKDVRREIKKYGGEQSVKNYYEEMQKKVDSVKKRRNMFLGFSGSGKAKVN